MGNECFKSSFYCNRPIWFCRHLLEDNPAWGIKAREYWKQQYSHLLDALFEWTFFDTTYLQLWINHDHGAEAFLPIVDSFRGFVNLEKLSVVNDSLLKLLFPLLQQGNPVLLPALKSLCFYDVKFQRSSDSILRVADFLQWRKSQGFPVPRIGIEGCWINKKYILRHVQETVVEIDDTNFSDSDAEE